MVVEPTDVVSALAGGTASAWRTVSRGHAGCRRRVGSVRWPSGPRCRGRS